MSADITVTIAPDPVITVEVVDSLGVALEAILITGPAGPQGEPPEVSRYRRGELTVDSDGKLTISAMAGSTLFVTLNRDVETIELTDWTFSDQAQRIGLYVRQDNTGNRQILASAWPDNTRAPLASPPLLSIAPGALDLVVLELVEFDGENTIFATIVARNYATF